MRTKPGQPYGPKQHRTGNSPSSMHRALLSRWGRSHLRSLTCGSFVREVSGTGSSKVMATDVHSSLSEGVTTSDSSWRASEMCQSAVFQPLAHSLPGKDVSVCSQSGSGLPFSASQLQRTRTGLGQAHLATGSRPVLEYPAFLKFDAIGPLNVSLYLDSVMRKRKKKMNKHKHRKRRKLLRHKS